MRGARILDLGTSLAAASCTRLLALAGADVVLVEPPDGAPLRRTPPLLPGGAVSATAAYLLANKRSIALDPRDPASNATLDRLCCWADAVVCSCEGPEEVGVALARSGRISAANPGCVYTVISPFGLTGPYAGYRSGDLGDWAAGGYLAITGDPGREPLQGGGPWPGHACALTAAIGTAAALLHVQTGGAGQLVDVGAMESLAALHQWSLTMFTHQGVVKRRAGNRMAESYHPLGLQRVADGWVCIAAATPLQWQNFCLALEMPELLVDDRFATGGSRYDHADMLDALIGPWLQARTRAAVVERLQAFRVPTAAVLSAPEILADPQLALRGFWVQPASLGPAARMPGAPFPSAGVPVAFHEAPRPGEHTRDVLREAGCNTAEIAAFTGAGAAGATEAAGS